MTSVGAMFLAEVLAETFEDFADDDIAREAGRSLHDALTRRGYELAPIGDERTARRTQLNEATLSAVRRFAGIADALGRDLDRAARVMAAMDVEPDEARRVEDAAWHSIWLHGSWRDLTTQMTTGQKEAAAAAVERHWYVPGDSMGAETRAELRWWEQ